MWRKHRKSAAIESSSNGKRRNGIGAQRNGSHRKLWRKAASSAA